MSTNRGLCREWTDRETSFNLGGSTFLGSTGKLGLYVWFRAEEGPEVKTKSYGRLPARLQSVTDGLWDPATVPSS